MLHASGLFCLSLSREPAVPRCTGSLVAAGAGFGGSGLPYPGLASLLGHGARQRALVSGRGRPEERCFGSNGLQVAFGL